MKGMKPKTKKIKPITELRQEYNELIDRIFTYTHHRDKARMQFTKIELQEEIHKMQDTARSLDHQINQRIINANKYLHAANS